MSDTCRVSSLLYRPPIQPDEIDSVRFEMEETFRSLKRTRRCDICGVAKQRSEKLNMGWIGVAETSFRESQSSILRYQDRASDRLLAKNLVHDACFSSLSLEPSEISSFLQTEARTFVGSL